MIENSQAWLGASTSAAIADNTARPTSRKLNSPTWTQSNLKEAIQAVSTQRMRFTQASTKYGIPKGTLYDNVLGKTRRLAVLDEVSISPDEEKTILDFCCDTSVSPYNRRTNKTLTEVLIFVQKLLKDRNISYEFTGLTGFRWWWAFCKRYSIVSTFFEEEVLKNKKGKRRDENEET